MNNSNSNHSENLAGLFTLSLRLVIGWTYFSAFWRRLILENKLIPDEAGYIGEKFNHFLPNALGIKPIIEHLVTHPEQLQTAMVIFTIIEAVVGLFIILGLFTRAMSLGVFGLALGILLGSGWLGTTCLDEWQIGVLGIAGGFTLFLSGSDAYSLDKYLIRKNYRFTTSKGFFWIGSGKLPIQNPKPLVLVISLIIFGLTLFTNQYFHGGLWGKLHNKSVKPKIEISNIRTNNSELSFEMYRTEGADVYGSFLIEIQILNEKNEVIKSWPINELSKFDTGKIKNHYVTKVKPGKHSLIIPLGAKADLTLNINDIKIAEKSKLKLIDISGLEWEKLIR
ncbi:TQO small subunit DoxD domain-containing protein [Flavobacterium saliperosum S13]|uniref:Thiosulfate dehydrogenase [quinone] large subunit n=2 Tax=Flavobacterium saliperosum TaxID=329186 RepID=A0A1G4VX32_9FLAO|nr:TQO small subunit DoxD [Flavobacterium saliperosum]ESU26837.1 TQO small subunit DoxD domain-containing protein [Flavobacterium saliperosum S13]SCX13280.1 thiosulfate dehydrogenase [quinone] large subunit [Flavobacterium saliperosum]